jgi:signal peptidase complex subunit 3
VLVGCNIGTSYLIPTNPDVHFAVTSLQLFQRHPASQNDLLSLTFDLKADLTSLFHWNTKQLFVYVSAQYATERNAVNQIVLWDDIIRRKEDAVLDYTDTRIEYLLIDQGHALRCAAPPLASLIIFAPPPRRVARSSMMDEWMDRYLA